MSCHCNIQRATIASRHHNIFGLTRIVDFYGKIVNLARLAINRPIVNLGDFKTFSCNLAVRVVGLERSPGVKDMKTI
jgi:hypothetical protein